MANANLLMARLLKRLLLLSILLPGIGLGAAIESLDLAEPAIRIEEQNGMLVMDVAYRVPVPPRAAWAVLTDFEHMPDFVPNLASSKVLQRNGKSIVVEQKGSMRLGMLPIHYESTRQIDIAPYQFIRSHTLSGDTRLESVMVLTPAGGDTLLSYHATAASDLPLPNSLVGSYLSGMLESQFKAMRQEMLRRSQTADPAIEDSPPRPTPQAAAGALAKAAAAPPVRPVSGQGRPEAKKARAPIKKRPG